MSLARGNEGDPSVSPLAPPDIEKSWMRCAIALIGILMVPMVVVGVLVAVMHGASYFVAGPLVLLVGGLLAKIVPYYFPSDP